LSLSASWAGGVKGRQVIDRLLVQVAHLLSTSGLFYLVVVQDNDPGNYNVSQEKSVTVLQRVSIACYAERCDA